MVNLLFSTQFFIFNFICFILIVVAIYGSIAIAAGTANTVSKKGNKGEKGAQDDTSRMSFANRGRQNEYTQDDADEF